MIKNQTELLVVSSCILALSPVTTNRPLGRRSDGQPVATINKRKLTKTLTDLNVDQSVLLERKGVSEKYERRTKQPTIFLFSEQNFIHTTYTDSYTTCIICKSTQEWTGIQENWRNISTTKMTNSKSFYQIRRLHRLTCVDVFCRFIIYLKVRSWNFPV